MSKLEIMIKMYESGCSYATIAKTLKIKSPSTVMNHLKKAGVKARSNKETARKYTANFDYFETIDTEDKAYWLGFMYADGYISKKPSRLLGVALSIKDKEHIEKFKKAIQATHPIRTYDGTNYGEGKQYVRLHLISDKLVKDIEQHGVVEKKSDVLQPPTTVPQELVHHFIRGYFDGDGSWSKSQRGVGYKFSVTGTEEMLIWIAEQIGITSKLYARHPNRDTNNFTLEAQAKSDLLKIVNYMYRGDATQWLDRKLDMAINLVPLCSNT